MSMMVAKIRMQTIRELVYRGALSPEHAQWVWDKDDIKKYRENRAKEIQREIIVNRKELAELRRKQSELHFELDELDDPTKYSGEDV